MWKALAPPLAAFAVSLLVVPESRGQTPVTETIALTFDSIPEGERLLRSFGAPAIDAEGVVVFNADARAQGSAFPFLLILKSTGSGTTLTRIPDVPPGFSTDEMDVPFAFFLPSGPIVNAGGTVAFTSLVHCGFIYTGCRHPLHGKGAQRPERGCPLGRAAWRG